MPKQQVIIAYVPVLHAGYKQLFDKHPHATIYVLGADLISRFDQFRKELRALKPADAAAGIVGWGREVRQLDEATLAELKKAQPEVIIPDEDVTIELVDGIFDHVKRETIFLRWDRRKMEAEADVVPDRAVSDDEANRELIRQSTQIGRKSSNLWRRMGALIVKDGEVLITAYNHSHPTVHTSWIDGDPRNNANRGTSIDLTTDIHAEAGAIADAARQGIELGGTCLYVMDFPCPTCAKLIANSGIAKLFYGRGYAVLDGEQALKASNVEVIHVTGIDVADSDPDAWVPYPEKKK